MRLFRQKGPERALTGFTLHLAHAVIDLCLCGRGSEPCAPVDHSDPPSEDALRSHVEGMAREVVPDIEVVPQRFLLAQLAARRWATVVLSAARSRPFGERGSHGRGVGQGKDVRRDARRVVM